MLPGRPRSRRTRGTRTPGRRARSRRGGWSRRRSAGAPAARTCRPPHHHTSTLTTTPVGRFTENILRQSYGCLATMPQLRSTYDGRLIY